MSVAILIPVLNRPHRIEPLLTNIAETTPESHSVWFAASDQPTIDILDRLGANYICDDGQTYPVRINALFKATNEPYVFLAADDLNFRSGWFQAAMRVMDQFPNSSGVVAINDLHNQAGTHFLVARSYVQTLGASGDGPNTLLCEEYRHTYCDDEVRSVARKHERWAVASESIVEHMHVGNGKAPMDDTYRLGESTMTQGREVYMRRAHLWS